MSDWYTGGYDEKEEVKQGSNRVYRFYLPKPSKRKVTTEITIVDGATLELAGSDGKNRKIAAPFMVREHQFRIDGDWKNWFTCISRGGDCAPCQKGNGSYQIAVYTIIDHTEWEDRSGNLHKDEVKLLCVKTSTTTFRALEKRAKRAKKNGLRGVKFEVERSSDRSVNVGDLYEYVDTVDLPEDLKPFNYLELFAPKTSEELASIWRSSDDAPVEAGDEAIPF